MAEGKGIIRVQRLKSHTATSEALVRPQTYK